MLNFTTIKTVNCPNNSKLLICYPTQGKPFIVTKSKHKSLKPNNIYMVDIKAKPYANSTKTYVFAIYVLATIKKTTTKK
jgi:hypothetical protein